MTKDKHNVQNARHTINPLQANKVSAVWGYAVTSHTLECWKHATICLSTMMCSVSSTHVVPSPIYQLSRRTSYTINALTITLLYYHELYNYLLSLC